MEEPSECSRELGVTIVEEESGFKLLLLQPHQDVSTLLLDPLVVRAVRRWTEEYLACADMDEGQAIGKPYAERRDHALGEEIASYQRVHVQSDELPPNGFLGMPTADRRRRKPFLLIVHGDG